MDNLLTTARPFLITPSIANSFSWVGHSTNGNNERNRIAGQTFTSPADGWLDAIDIFTAAIPTPGNLKLTLFSFDEPSHQWNSELATSSLPVEKKLEDGWVRFRMEPVALQKDASYGFRLYSSDALLAIGETARTVNQPGIHGLEWTADEPDAEGSFFAYFNLVFRLAIRA